jgi:pimeloyl-ACP methyl ester carboxylesterase
MSGWARAYRPLRPRTLGLQLAILVVVEVLLFTSYRGHEASFHWATHFLVAMIMWSAVNLAVLVLKGAPAPGQLLTLFGWHLFAMFPDLLFSRAEVPHDDWMDVFLGHISSHYMPGGAYTWLFLALVATALYVIVLAGWLCARRSEADAGMAPGIGLGGSHLVRAQRSPAVRSLAHLRLGPDRPPDVVLLHGLGASSALWRPVAEDLAHGGHSVLAPDLLGFGGSRGIGTTFGLAEHVDALERLLEETGAQQPLVVGHSFGCAVAAAFADRRPEQVRALVLVSPPAFRDAEEARKRLGERGWLARHVLEGTPAASLVCNTMCLTRSLAGRVVPRVVSTLPTDVARESVEHTWPAYRDALAALLEDNPVPDAIEDPQRPTLVILGEDDPQTPTEDVLAYPHGLVRVEVWPADHLLPLRLADRLAGALDAELLSGSR